MRHQLWITTHDDADERLLAKAMSKALDTITEVLGEDFAWDAVALDRHQIPIDSAGHNSEEVPYA